MGFAAVMQAGTEANIEKDLNLHGIQFNWVSGQHPLQISPHELTNRNNRQCPSLTSWSRSFYFPPTYS